MVKEQILLEQLPEYCNQYRNQPEHFLKYSILLMNANILDKNLVLVYQVIRKTLTKSK